MGAELRSSILLFAISSEENCAQFSGLFRANSAAAAMVLVLITRSLDSGRSAESLGSLKERFRSKRECGAVWTERRGPVGVATAHGKLGASTGWMAYGIKPYMDLFVVRK
jgi:hypothetical protein